VSIAITEEQLALRDTVARWAEQRGLAAHAREALDAPGDALPPFWDELVAQGWPSVHLPAAAGGGGAGITELAVVLEALARAGAPGPVLPTALAGALLAAAGADKPLADVVAGAAAAVAWNAGSVQAVRTASGWRVEGDAGLVVGAATASLLLVGADHDSGRIWFALEPSGLTVHAAPSLDNAHRLARVTVAAEVSEDGVLQGVDDALVTDLAVTLAAAEAAGTAAWCQETATEYAKVREQFGRPIGSFQAVKHACANMLAKVEMARTAAWDAAQAAGDPAQRSLAAAAAGAVALDAAVECAKMCIQILGGIGYTWEHDAHLYLRRGLALRQLLGPVTAWRADAARAALSGARRRLTLDLPPEAEAMRAEVRAFVAEIVGQDADAQRRQLARSGYLVPHWPAPWGRGAGPVEQLVIAEEFRTAGVRPPGLMMGDWVLPTLVQYGDEAQKERFVLPTLEGELVWCQLFSEPGAGSDLAAVATKATRVEGGWVLNGQKVWNSLAAQADWAICIARSDPDAPKHDGITYFLVDMRTEGIDVRPLREITGHALFNEVFLSDVFVPDDLVVGEVHQGWRLARTTLANERVAMSAGSALGGSLEQLIELAGRTVGDDAVALDRLGALVADEQTLSVMAHRTTLRRVSGTDPGPGASVRKLLSGLHQQASTEFGLEMLGAEGATTEGDAAAWSAMFLAMRAITIAGGTTEVQRNLIAERLLGLPRDDN